MKKKFSLTKIKLPDSLQGILWSKNIENINLEEDKVYIIHQILAYGDIKEVEWLFEVYPKNDIKNIFINRPVKIYTRPVYFFIKDFILNIKKDTNENNYVKNISGSIR